MQFCPPLFISASSEPGLRHVSVGDGKITLLIFTFSKQAFRERSGSVVECLIRERRAAGSSLTGVTALCP